MIKNFFLITLRSMMKNKLFLIINVVGMGIAIACCIVGYFVYDYDATFDAVHKNADHIYRVSNVRDFNNQLSRVGFVPLPLGNVVSQTIKDVDKSSRYYHSWSNFKKHDDLFQSKLFYVDPDFFEMFSFDFIIGDAKALRDKNNVFVSEQMAIRLFGSAKDAYAKTITQTYNPELKELKIAGVFKDAPQNSSFFLCEAYVHFDNAKDEHKEYLENDWRKETTLFVQINDPTRVSSVHQQLQPFKDNNNKVREDFIINEFTLDSFSSMAHNDRDNQIRVATSDAPPFSAVIGTAIMGILILLIACFNLTNTAISISSRRLKEIGIRKVMGSRRQQLIAQFLGETTFVCLLALMAGLIFADFLIAGWNNMWDFMHISPNYADNPRFMLFLVGVLVLTGLLAGSYPAFYISKFEPISILKGKLKFGGTNSFTQILLGLQFSISLIAIVSAIAFVQNSNYQQAYDLGFDAKGSIIVWLQGDENEAYKNAVKLNPEVLSVAGASSGIFSNRAHQTVKHQTKQVEVDIIDVGHDYLETMNITLTNGRDFIKDSETDKRESIIISKKMASLFGWENPIGKELLWKDSVKLFVVGVVKDVYTDGLWSELEPLMIRYIGPEKYTQLVVNTKVASVTAVNGFMEAKWKGLFPNRLYNGRMMVTVLDQVYKINKNITAMYTFLGLIALMLSATGLFTLVSLNIIKRTKEIGIRKVLGASIGNITRIINKEFFIILIIASFVGCTLSYFAVDSLMNSIWEYYQSTTVFTFGISVFVMLFVSAIVVGYKVFVAASMNPVNTLRDE